MKEDELSITKNVQVNASCFFYHVLHGSASTVVRNGPKAYSNTLNRPATDPKRLHLSKPKFTQFITFRGTPHRVKFIVIRWTGPRPPRDNIYEFCQFFFILFVSCSRAQRERLCRFWRSIHQTTQSNASKCPFGIVTMKMFVWGVMPHKFPHFAAGRAISSWNIELNNFWRAKPILVTYSSNNAASWKELRTRGQNTKICFLGIINKKISQREFSRQNTPLHSFLTIQPVHTNSNTIEAAQRAK